MNLTKSLHDVLSGKYYTYPCKHCGKQVASSYALPVNTVMVCAACSVASRQDWDAERARAEKVARGF